MNTNSLVHAVPGGVVVSVHVQPRAGRTQVAGRLGDALKIRVAAPPVDGRATEAARQAIAAAFGVAPAAVSLVTGEKSRLKRFRLAGVSLDDATARVSALSAAGRG
jgi:uncharacterized protein (TIGR00251 family)